MKRDSAGEEFKIVRCASVEELQKLCADQDRSCKIILAGGELCSSKVIRFDTKTQTFQIYNCIDGHEQTLTPQALSKQTILNDAIAHGCLGVEVRPYEPWCEHQRFSDGECPVCGVRREV